MSVDFQSVSSMADYLAGVNIVRLQYCARQAGLRWKSGAPGYDKAGIIEKLRFSPSMMRATVSAAQRQEQGATGNNPFADDIAEESKAAPAPVQSQPAQTGEIPGAAIQALSGRVERLETYAVSRTQAEFIAAQVYAEESRPLANEVQSLAHETRARLAELEARKPVQFTIEGVKTPEITGQHAMFPELVQWLTLRAKDDAGNITSRTNVFLVGPAGTGKTSAAVAFAKMKGLELYAQPLTMDAFGVVGFTTATGEIIQTEFSRAWRHGGVFLWDEISMSAPDAIGALNSALANGFIALPGVGNVKAHPDFYCIVGDNSDTGANAKFSARNSIDGATLDRFITLTWDIDPVIEAKMSGGFDKWLSAVRAIRAFIEKGGIEHVGATPRAVITGALALQAGTLTREQILRATCCKGILRETWPQVLNLPAVQSFIQGA